jgi:hypothetical protein
MHKTAVCHEGDLYYIVAPLGDAKKSVVVPKQSAPGSVPNKFSIPPGMTSLDGSQWSKLKWEDIAIGSVRTWKFNSRQNGGARPDLSNLGSISDLANRDLTTPGFFRLPVCSPDMAYMAWNSKSADRTDPSYPCVRV